MAVLVLVLALCVVIVSCVTSDPCLTYDNLNADSTRSPSHLESVYVNKNCDATLPEKWYRLTGDAGTDLTNDSSVLVSDGCGTAYQLWMNGSIPDVSDGIVDRTICGKSVFHNCHTSFTVEVKNCCSFRVYNLKSASSCPTSYCVSPSSVPAVDCPTTTTTATTTTTTTTTSTTTGTTTTPEPTTTTTATTTQTTTQPNAVKTKSGNKHLTIVNTINNEIIITVVVLLVIITVVLIGIVVFKFKKCSKVEAESRDFTAVQFIPNIGGNGYVEFNNTPPVTEKGGVNSCNAQVCTGHH